MRRLLVRVAGIADAVTQWMLDFLEITFPGPDDDLMAIAYATAETLPVDMGPAQVYVFPASVREHDHAACEGQDCDRIICNCPSLVACEGTTDRGCGHLNNLCDQCRPECSECMADLAYDAGRW